MNKRETFKGILRYLKPYAPLLCISVLCALVNVAAQLAVPFLIGRAVDFIVGAGNVDYPAIFRLFFVIGVCIAAAFAAQFAMSLINNRIVYHVLCAVRMDTFSKFQRLPLSFLDSHAYGEIAGIVLTDAEQFADGLLLGFTQLFTGVVTILGVLVILFVLRWEIALVVDEAIGNLKVVKAYTHEDENAAFFAEQNEEYRKCSLRAVFYASTPNPVTRFVNSLVYAGVALTGALLAIGVCASLWVSDSFAYLVGSRFGKHKMVPKISPKKSWEGFFGGLAGSVLIWIILWATGQYQLSAWYAVVCGIVVGVLGVIGDLIASRIKRGAGVKDSGNLIPGHGGMLDRSDSLIFGAITAYLMLVIGGVL